MSLVTLVLVMQSLYIDQFYMDRKINKIIVNLNDFAKEYQEKDWQIQELARQINNYSSVNNANLMVNGINYDFTEGMETIWADNLITIVVQGEKYYDVYLDETT